MMKGSVSLPAFEVAAAAIDSQQLCTDVS